MFCFSVKFWIEAIHCEPSIHTNNLPSYVKRMQAGTGMPPRRKPPPALQGVLEEFLSLQLPKIVCHWDTAIVTTTHIKDSSHIYVTQELHVAQMNGYMQSWSCQLAKSRSLVKGCHGLTGSTKGVLMNHGATELLLLLSFAHSHAKLLASWFIAPTLRKNKETEFTAFRVTI